MSSKALVIKRNDTNPVLVQLKDRNGPVDVTGATFRFLVSLHSGTSVIDSSNVSIVDGPQGKIQYEPVATEVDEDLIGRGEIEVTFSNGKIQTFPNDNYFEFEIVKDLG